MITGGLGGLGLRAATLLIRRGATHVVLGSRGGRVARGGQGLEAQLQTLGKSVSVKASDSAVLGDVNALMQVGHPLVGVLHAAGVADKGLLVGVAAHRAAWIHSPKAVGAWHVQCARCCLAALAANA